MLVEYEFTLDDAKRNLKQLLRYFCRKLVIPVVLLAVLGVVLIVLNLTEFTDDKMGLYLGCIVLGCAVFAVIMFVAVYVMTLKNTEKSFGVYGKDGREKLSIEYADGIYVFSNLSKGNVARYSATDITSAKVYRDLILVKLVSKELIIFPNDLRIRELFDRYLMKK